MIGKASAIEIKTTNEDQSLGQAPTCILTLYADSSPVRHGDFTHDERFTAEKKGTRLTLTIRNIREADSGIYYCAARDYDLVFFSNGVFLKYEGPNIKSFNYQINKIPSMDQTEDSPKLKEAVYPGDSILFGSGSRLEITDPNSETAQMYWNLIALAASNVLCVIIIVVLLCARTKKRNISTSGQPERLHSTSAPFPSPVNEAAERKELSYAAIHFPARKSKRRETQEEACTNVIYSSVHGLS
ncbi:hypothetical protein SRHO_G00022900 [Serrasalmus rhombeus]